MLSARYLCQILVELLLQMLDLLARAMTILEKIANSNCGI